MSSAAAAKAAAAAAAAAAAIAAANNLASEHSKSFSFCDITWLESRLERHVRQSGGYLELHPQNLIEEWLQFRWPRRLESYTPHPALMNEVAASLGLSLQQPVTFLQVVQFVHAYQELHIENEPSAGFSEKHLKVIDARFKPFDKHGDGLKAKELWDCLTSFGVNMKTVEDQQWIINLVRLGDKDNNGLIDFQEFCQILRKLNFRKVDKENLREHELIMKSKIAVQEASAWVQVFRRADEDQKNELSKKQIRGLFDGIGIKWGSEGNEQIDAWAKEFDANNNGSWDFGEFCCLIQKMVEHDFAGIKEKIKGTTADPETVISKTGNVRWSSDPKVLMDWASDGEPVSPCSPTGAPRASAWDLPENVAEDDAVQGA